MTAQVIIAARGGEGAKSRLAGMLSPADRAGLVRAMLQDMLTAVAACARAQVWVVTPTPELAGLAREAGAAVVLQSGGGGLNAGFEEALVKVAEAAPYAVTALLPGDLPLLESSDLDAALMLAETHDVVLAPAAADGGTGAVILKAGVAFTPQFGVDSFQRHLKQARRRGYCVARVDVRSLGHDIDSPEDVAGVLSGPQRTRTATFLAEHLRRRSPS